jgi:hypothetical protein
MKRLAADAGQNLSPCILVSGGFKFASAMDEMGEVIDK